MILSFLRGRNCGPARLFAPADAADSRGWPGYEAETSQLDATITDLGLTSSLPSLQVRARDGMNWTVELGNRRQTESAGLTKSSAAPGDLITITGHKATGFGDRRIRAARLTIAGRRFDLSPEACLEA